MGIKKYSTGEIYTESFGRSGLVLLLTLFLGACSSDGMRDLDTFIATTKATPGGRVAPLPEFKPFETYIFQAEKSKDPFKPWESESRVVAEVSGTSNGITPEANRRKEITETFPLDALKMMGTIEKDSQVWGLVKAQDGIVYRVKQGNYLGQNHGRISIISENTIKLTEIVPDGLGGWEERQASISLDAE